MLTKNRKMWVGALLGLAVVAGTTVYKSRSGKIEGVEVKSNLDFSTLHPSNPGCSITDTGGRAIDLSTSQVIPKGSLISSHCFDTGKQ